MNDFTGFIVFFGVDDLQKVKQFYGDLLGLELFKDQGVCQIYKVTETSAVGFCTHLNRNNQVKSPIITLLSHEVDAVYDRIKKAGYPLAEEPRLNPKFGIYHFFVIDPQGYTVEIQRFID